MNRIMDHPKDISPLRQSSTPSQGPKKTDQPSSYFQQKNSKMDTPILNRKTAKQRIWNSSGCAQKGKRSLFSYLKLIKNPFGRRKDSSFGFGEISETRKNLLHDSAAATKSTKQ